MNNGSDRIGCRRQRLRLLNARHLGMRGRREVPSRAAGSQPGYVDRYPGELMWIALGILVLCALDATFTLELLQRDAVELNGLMAALIERDVRTFVYAKLALTGLSVVLMVVHCNFWVFRVRVTRILTGALGIYAVLVCYEIVLLLA